MSRSPYSRCVVCGVACTRDGGTPRCEAHRGCRPGTWLAVLAIAALLTGCAMPAESYVRADAATWNVVAPELAGRIAADEGVPEIVRLGWAAVLDTWRLRIEAAAAGLGMAQLRLNYAGPLQDDPAGAPPTQSDEAGELLTPRETAAASPAAGDTTWGRK